MCAATVSAEQRLVASSEACREALAKPPFLDLVKKLGNYATPLSAFALLLQVTRVPATAAELFRLRELAPAESEQNLVERALLLLAAQHVVERICYFPIAESVKHLFAEEFEFYANPPHRWIESFRAGQVRYQEMARIVTLRRFPAGQFHWEVAGFPRSWVVRADRVLRLLAHIVGRMHGFAPLFEVHVNDRRKNRLVLLETEGCRSYYKMARSLERQPRTKGVLMASWLFCESTARISPHLSWLREVPLRAGALAVNVGPAEPDSGFLVGSDERRVLYEEGKYRPYATCILWPRSEIIAWANHHSEFADEP